MIPQVTIFPTVKNPKGQRKPFSFDDFKKPAIRNQKDGPLLSLAIYKNNRRASANVESIAGAVLDFDSAKPGTLEMLKNELQGLAAVVHTTFSYTEEKPKYRVVILFDRPVSPAEYPRVIDAVIHALGDPEGIDLSCKETSRAYYLPACPEERAHLYQCEIFDGKPLTVSELLDVPIESTPNNGHKPRRTQGRNDTLKAQATAGLKKGKAVDKVVRELLAYDKKIHNQPLFEDRSEGGDPNDPEAAALRFVVSLRKCIGPNPGPKPPSTKRQTGMTGAELVSAVFAEVRFIVSGLIPEGLCLLVGAPKTGKSWIMLLLAKCVSGGEKFLNAFDCEPGAVLYLALEDSLRRLQKRLRIMGVSSLPENVYFETVWPRADQGGVEKIRDWLEQHSDARLVIIDTLARFRGQSNSKQSAYMQDSTDLIALQQLAGEFQVCILVVHHTRKMTGTDWIHEISGTLGLSGVADSIMLLRRERKENEAFLLGTGRDIEDLEYPIVFDPKTGCWSLVGLSPAAARATVKQRNLIEVLKNYPDGTRLTTLAHDTKDSKQNARDKLLRLQQAGAVRQTVGGLWVLA